jgi:hypothetical protein
MPYQSIPTMKKSLLLFLFIAFTLIAGRAQEVPVPSPADSVNTQGVIITSPADTAIVLDISAEALSDTLKTQDAGAVAPVNAVKISKNLIKFNGEV